MRIEEFVGGYGQRPIQLAWLPQVSSFSSSSSSLLDSDEEDEVSETDAKGLTSVTLQRDDVGKLAMVHSASPA